MIKTVFALLLAGSICAQPSIKKLSNKSTASLRGLYAVSDKVCWTSGSEGTVLLTKNGGQTWLNRSPDGFGTLQFRDVHAFDGDTALVLSAGLPGVILKTTNGGLSWHTVYQNNSQGVFFDAFDFWDNQHGIAFSDAPADKLLIIKTVNWGKSWEAVPFKNLPQVHAQQGGFAASGTCLKTFGKNSVIIGLGGPSPTTLLSNDKGLSWSKGGVPLDSGDGSKGIFSFDFWDAEHGLCVGGDYTGDSATRHSAAFTNNGGKTWQLIEHPAISGHYRSCIKYFTMDTLVAVSRTGISHSTNGGLDWQIIEGNYYTVSVAKGTVWLSGPMGALAKMEF